MSVRYRNTVSGAVVTYATVMPRLERSDRFERVADTPSQDAVKAVWVDHAVSQGEDRQDAESATKADLIERHG